MTEAEYVSWVRDGRPKYRGMERRIAEHIRRRSSRVYVVTDERIVASMADQLGPESNAARALAEVEARWRMGECVSIYIRGLSMFVGGNTHDDLPRMEKEAEG